MLTTNLKSQQHRSQLLMGADAQNHLQQHKTCGCTISELDFCVSGAHMKLACSCDPELYAEQQHMQEHGC